MLCRSETLGRTASADPPFIVFRDGSADGTGFWSYSEQYAARGVCAERIICRAGRAIEVKRIVRETDTMNLLREDPDGR